MDFLDKWLYIIRNCNFDNTYKMAWAKAISEISLDIDYNKSQQMVKITLLQLAERIIRYYWDQTIYFDLQQGSNPFKPPEIITITKGLIQFYQSKQGSIQPIKFLKSRVEDECAEKYQQAVANISRTLKKDVSYRFIRVSSKDVEGVYDYQMGADYMYINVANLKALSDNHTTVFEAINYRWAQILEGFNNTPRICKKVRIIDDKNIRRKPLKSFSKYLDIENPAHVCFICGEKIAETPAIDHVLPWSYLYSDDLWNLVYVHQSCNSSKSNIIPDEQSIEKLEHRNHRLIEGLEMSGMKDKNIFELEMGIQKNLVRKFWIACKG